MIRAFLICTLIVLLFFGSYGVLICAYQHGNTAQAATSEESSQEKPIIIKIPEKYVENPRLLILDYQSQRISTEIVMQILILRSIANDGVFVLLDEADTYLDLFFIDRERHAELVEEKEMMIQQRSLRKKK